MSLRSGARLGPYEIVGSIGAGGPPPFALSSGRANCGESRRSQTGTPLRPLAGPGRRQRVSPNGGRYALWRKDGAELFFLSADNQIMAAAIRAQGSEIHVGAIRPLFRIQPRRVRLDAYPYAVSPDGQRFLVSSVVEEAAPPAISLLVNWRAALNR